MGKNAGDTIIAPGETNIQVFTSTGTWNKPNGVRAVRVRTVGGGGGCGGCAFTTGQANSAGGHGGGYAEAYILAANLLSSETVTVGAAGAAAASGNNAGGSGGTSSFGAHCSATGGGGGIGMASTTGNSLVNGNSPGTGSGGDINLSGGSGGFGQVIGGVALRAAHGGAAGGGLGQSNRMATAAGTGVAGLVYGGGAPGIYVTAASIGGAPGGAGVVIVESIF